MALSVKPLMQSFLGTGLKGFLRECAPVTEVSVLGFPFAVEPQASQHFWASKFKSTVIFVILVQEVSLLCIFYFEQSQMYVSGSPIIEVIRSFLIVHFLL